LNQRKISNERRNVTPERTERKESRTSVSDTRTSPIHIEVADNTTANRDTSSR